MKRVRNLASLLALGCAAVWGDTIVFSNGDSLVNIPDITGSLGTGSPFWDNLSGDGNQMNVGYLLTGSGGFTGDPNYNPTQYVSQNNGGNPDAPSNLSFLRDTSNPLQLILLSDLTEDFTDSFGFYDASAPDATTAASSEIPIYGPGPLAADIGSTINLSIANAFNYGFYLTRCISYTNGTNSTCLQYTTWFSNSTFDTTDVGYQHFAFFAGSTPGTYYVAMDDWLPVTIEGYGDFNDIVFQLTSGPASTPEPATLALMGFGLLGLGIARRRCSKRPI